MHMNNVHFVWDKTINVICFCFQQAVMQTYENKGADFYTNGSVGHMNGAELTKMKEVAFEKNPSEPMVCYLPLHTHLFIFPRVLLIPPR